MHACAAKPVPPSLVRYFPAPKPAARAVVLAFPHAGGRAIAFASWAARLPGWLDLCAFAAPGRQGVSDDVPCLAWPALAALAGQAASGIDLPVVLFGHSFGAWLAYDAAVQRADAGRPPLHLVLAAARPPHLPRPEATPPQDDESLLAYVRALGGTSEDVLRHPELRRSLLSSLRADLAAAADYRQRRRGPLAADATILCGEDDPGLAPADAARWRELLSGDVASLVLPGGHFFVHESRDRVIAALIGRLRPERG